MSYRILCAYEPSPAGDRAFEFALDLARRVGGELFVLSVFQPREDARDSDPATVREMADRQFEPAFERLRLRVAELGHSPQFRVSIGYPALDVLSDAVRLRIQHIIVGAEASRSLAEPSPAHRIALMAECAVTVMR
jgi:nucleotide-binding universal stress UspA family protein